MPKRTRGLKLEVTDHAWRRYCERVGPVSKEELAGLVGTFLRHQLRLGLPANGQGFVVRLPDYRADGILVTDIEAIVVPEVMRWVMVTVKSVRVGVDSGCNPCYAEDNYGETGGIGR